MPEPGFLPPRDRDPLAGRMVSAARVKDMQGGLSEAASRAGAPVPRERSGGGWAGSERHYLP